MDYRSPLFDTLTKAYDAAVRLVASMRLWWATKTAEQQALIASGICTGCHREDAEPGYITCDGCYAIGIE